MAIIHSRRGVLRGAAALLVASRFPVAGANAAPAPAGELPFFPFSTVFSHYAMAEPVASRPSYP
jgi:hypothetical protein